MTADTLLIQIRSLETQLTMLKAELKQFNQPRKTLADYYGLLQGLVETTEEEILSIKLKVKVEPA